MNYASFPADFLWGAATAAYQIEGATQEDQRGASIWDQFAARPGATYSGHTGAVAADHYHRMPEDVALMSALGLNAYRFSVAWPRILPDGTGASNPLGLDFYDRLVDALLAANIEPAVTLYHWDLPLALHARGGWLNRNTAAAFADYAEVVARRLGDRVRWWITHNEPWCQAYLGYGSGVHAPGEKSLASAVVAAHHLMLSHGLALPRLRQTVRADAQVGITLNLYPVYAADDTAEMARAVEHVDAFRNRWFLDPIFRGAYPAGYFEALGVPPPPMADGDLRTISQPLDFLGVNYYSRTLIHGRPDGGYDEVSHIAGAHYTAMRWEVFPEGLATLLQRVHHDYAPARILITENGSAYDDQVGADGSVLDPERLAYFERHIDAVGAALRAGVPIHGYFAWSLMDNFEWAEGYRRRFGMVYVDYPTQRRTIKSSGAWYREHIRQHHALYQPAATKMTAM